jgi:hypothetical protein
MKRRETELERVLKEALTLSEEERKKRYWWRSLGKDDSLEAKLAAFFPPSARVAILKWAWIISLLMLVMGYIIIFFKLFPEKRPF